MAIVSEAYVDKLLYKRTQDHNERSQIDILQTTKKIDGQMEHEMCSLVDIRTNIYCVI